MPIEFESPLSSGGGEYTPSGGGKLTSLGEIQRLFSVIGVDVRSDDYGSDADDIMDEIVDWAHETVESYTLSHYDTSVLLSSPWSRRRATIIGAYYLSMRRGNPPQFVAEAKRVFEELEKIQQNKLLIPDSVVRAADIPAVSSYRIDDRYVYGKQRVLKSQSSSPYPGQPYYEMPYGGDEI